MSSAPTNSKADRRATFTDNAAHFSRQISALGSLRDDWLERGLATEPSDRSNAESAVAQLYLRSGCRKPTFIWVPSPPAGVELVATEGLSSATSLAEDGVHGASVRIASTIARSRERMDTRIAHRRPDWPFDGWSGTHRRTERWGIETARRQSAEDSAHDGIEPSAVIHAAVWDSLRTSLFDGAAAAIRTLPSTTGGVTWYGQQEAHRVAYYDIVRRLDFARFRSDDHDLLEVLAALTRSTGWWWAFDDVCIMTERPSTLDTEPTPGAFHNERRLHNSDSPALEFRDGRSVYVQHGTIVPSWVVLDPTVERIAAERNVEVRRCAIERIGWDTYIDAAGLALIDRTDDPGNAGCELRLYSTPDTWDRGGRILLAVNGSRERDGHRRRYGLHVPRWMPSALDAAGWTYGVSGVTYSRLARRT